MNEYFVKDPEHVIRILDPNLLQLAYRYSPEEFFTEGLDWYKNQVSIVSLPPEVFEELNLNRFTFEAIEKNHGSQLIDVRIQ
jgi:hypothetical protein